MEYRVISSNKYFSNSTNTQFIALAYMDFADSAKLQSYSTDYQIIIIREGPYATEIKYQLPITPKLQ